MYFGASRLGAYILINDMSSWWIVPHPDSSTAGTLAGAAAARELHPFSHPYPASPASPNMPTFRCCNVWVLQACLHVEQESFCWIINARLVVNLRGDSNGLLTPP